MCCLNDSVALYVLYLTLQGVARIMIFTVLKGSTVSVCVFGPNTECLISDEIAPWSALQPSSDACMMSAAAGGVMHTWQAGGGKQVVQWPSWE